MNYVFKTVMLFSILGFLFVTSCKYEPEPTIAIISVVTENGDPVPYANIVLSCSSSVNLPCDVEIVVKADEKGIYTQEFDQSKVLFIRAAGNIYDTITTGVPPIFTPIKDTICGTTTISIKPEQTNTQQVILYDCK